VIGIFLIIVKPYKERIWVLKEINKSLVHFLRRPMDIPGKSFEEEKNTKALSLFG